MFEHLWDITKVGFMVCMACCHCQSFAFWQVSACEKEINHESFYEKKNQNTCDDMEGSLCISAVRPGVSTYVAFCRGG